MHSCYRSSTLLSLVNDFSNLHIDSTIPSIDNPSLIDSLVYLASRGAAAAFLPPLLAQAVLRRAILHISALFGAVQFAAWRATSVLTWPAAAAGGGGDRCDGGRRGGQRADATWLARTLSRPAQSRIRARRARPTTPLYILFYFLSRK